MKYFLKKNEVEVVNTPNGAFEITLFGNKKITLSAKEFPIHLTLSKKSAVAEEIHRLAQDIISSEIMVDDGNAEELLHNAVELARKIKKLS